MQQCRSMGLRPCMARALTESGHLRQSLGQGDEARDLWRQTARLMRTMGLEKAERLDVW